MWSSKNKSLWRSQTQCCQMLSNQSGDKHADPLSKTHRYTPLRVVHVGRVQSCIQNKNLDDSLHQRDSETAAVHASLTWRSTAESWPVERFSPLPALSE